MEKSFNDSLLIKFIVFGRKNKKKKEIKKEVNVERRKSTRLRKVKVLTKE